MSIGKKSVKSTPLQEDAEALAILALGFLAGDDERLELFIATTGADIDVLRKAAASPQTLGFVLDYLLGSEPLLLTFAAEAAIKPEAVLLARRQFPGFSDAS